MDPGHRPGDRGVYCRGRGPNPAGTAVAVKRAMSWSLWILFETTAAQEHLDLLRRLVTQARCYEANLAPDLFHAPNVLADFLP